MESSELARRIAEILEDHKAEDILVLDISGQMDFANYFVIASGTSDRMIDSLTNIVVDTVRDEYHLHAMPQGARSGGWMLVDYGDVIVHIFSPDRRSYYSLEDLYKESKVLLRVA